jgi:hypothetical protein
MLSSTLPIALDGTLPPCLTVRSQVRSQDTPKYTSEYAPKYTSESLSSTLPSMLSSTETRELLSGGQFGSRKRRSAIDAAAIIVDRAHAAWTEGNIAGVLLMDIKAAFPSVARGRLVHAMKGKRIDGDFIRWTESLLSDRTVEMVIEGNVLQRHPVEAGIPQGSPVSPILCAIYTAGLIE